MNVYSSKYKSTDWDKDNSLLANYWTSEPMDDEIFQKEIEVWADKVEELKPKRLLADTKLFNYTVSVEMQEWTNNIVFPRLINAGVEKFAVVQNDDLLTQLSLEQTMDEDAASAFQHRFFSDNETAIQWLKS